MASFGTVKDFFKECKENTTTFQYFAKRHNISSNAHSVLKQNLDDFFYTVDVSHVAKISHKVGNIVDLYFIHIEENSAKEGTKALLKEISTKEYVLFVAYFAGLVWKNIEVYDEDYNFYTRRIKLGMILHKKIAEYFDVRKRLL